MGYEFTDQDKKFLGRELGMPPDEIDNEVEDFYYLRDNLPYWHKLIGRK